MKDILGKGFADTWNSIESEAKPYTKEELSEIMEYDQGMKDCANGVIHKSKSAAYDRGYSDQYAYEQIKDAKEVI